MTQAKKNMNEIQNLCVVKEAFSKLFHLFEVLEWFGLLKEFIHSYSPSKPCMINFSSIFDQFWSSGIYHLEIRTLPPFHTICKRIPHFLLPFDCWTSRKSCLHTVDKVCSCYPHCKVFLSDFISTLDRMCSPQFHQLSENCQIH